MTAWSRVCASCARRSYCASACSGGGRFSRSTVGSTWRGWGSGGRRDGTSSSCDRASRWVTSRRKGPKGVLRCWGRATWKRSTCSIEGLAGALVCTRGARSCSRLSGPRCLLARRCRWSRWTRRLGIYLAGASTPCFSQPDLLRRRRRLRKSAGILMGVPLSTLCPRFATGNNTLQRVYWSGGLASRSRKRSPAGN